VKDATVPLAFMTIELIRATKLFQSVPEHETIQHSEKHENATAEITHGRAERGTAPKTTFIAVESVVLFAFDTSVYLKKKTFVRVATHGEERESQ